MEIVYFELNNWASKYAPQEEPFPTWMSYTRPDGTFYMQFRDEKWIKENKLVVVESYVDMSNNFCIAATKDWVLENCPSLLEEHNQEFICYDDEDFGPPAGQWGCPFLEYTEENIGYHFADKKTDWQGYDYYEIDPEYEDDCDEDEEE